MFAGKPTPVNNLSGTLLKGRLLTLPTSIEVSLKITKKIMDKIVLKHWALKPMF
jgi:hypothetical protein